MSSEPRLVWIQTCSVVLLLTGLVSRIAPLLDQGGRLLRQFPTEDGFLMMTVARNLALGHGLSSAHGEIPTNGVQPLFTFIQSLVFTLVGGDKSAGVLAVMLLQIVLALLGAWMIRELTGRLLAGRAHRSSIGLLAAALWFASPVVVNNSMNGLESCLYVVGLLGVMLVWLGDRFRNPGAGTSSGALKVGLMLGLVFWARNDAVFLTVAVLVGYGLPGLREGRTELGVWVKRCLITGVSALLVAAPWLIFNLTRFGSIVPISARAQADSVAFGANLIEVPSKLFEYVTLLAPIPTALETRGWVVVVTSAVTIGFFAAAIVLARRLGGHVGSFVRLNITFSALIVAYYGLVFGAPWFVSRYLFPLSPFMVILSASLIVTGVSRIPAGKLRTIRGALVVSLVILAVALNVRLYVKGPENRYMQIVEWIAENVADDQWVGAPQSGTIGFFHDRTVNLDGKLNPEALRARREGRIPDYIANEIFDEAGRRITYIADWSHIAKWQSIPLISSNFELIVEDAQADLAVWRRR